MNRAGALAAALLLNACATGRADDAPASGFLSAAEIDRLAEALPLPEAIAPVPQDAPSEDRRWLAIVHAELRPPEAAQHFDCALGVRFMDRPRPALTRLMARLARDTETASGMAARRRPVARPFAVPGGPEPCQRVTAAIRASPSWPAGGAAAGAAYGALMADLAPDRAGAARRIGRELGLSRAICGMNRAEEVAAGALLGLAIYAQAAATPEFARELAAARVEVAEARAEGLSNPGCAAERRALGIRPGAG